MKERIQNICRIQYVLLSQIDSEEIDRVNKTQSLSIDGDWVDLPIAKSGTMRIQTDEGKSGTMYSSDISCTLIEKVLVTEPIILKVTLTDDQTLYIGEKDFPVLDMSEQHMLAGKAISISYNSWHYPFEPSE